MFSFLVDDVNPTVILERSEGSKSEMRVTVLFLPALILHYAMLRSRMTAGLELCKKRSCAKKSAVRHFLVVDANPTVILERSEGSKSEMRVTVLFLPA